MYHTFETRIRLRSLGLGTPKEVRPMDEVAAIELGADMVGEVSFVILKSFQPNLIICLFLFTVFILYFN